MTHVQSLVFDDLLDPRRLRVSYQPIYDLVTGDRVAVEALTRWPDLDITPDRAFEWAIEAGRLGELDEACRGLAIDGAVDHGLPEGFGLFVNLEPSALTADTAGTLLERAGDRVRLVVEITERALMRRPAQLIESVRHLRGAGCAIALDDLGSVPDSLALLPFVAPDVVKLDLTLVQRWPDVEQAAVLTTVAAYAERTGATLLAEGIETEQHLAQALALGATLGQGWYFGQPGPLGALERPARSIGLRRPVLPTPTTPFALVPPATMRVAPKGLILGISRHLENQGLALEIPPVVLGAFQEVDRFTPATARRYERLAERCPLVVALGLGLGDEPVRGVRGADLSPDDPLRSEWTIAVVGVHYWGALIAQDLGDEGADRDRRFAFTVTHNPDIVLAAARSLIERVTSR